MTQKLLSRNRRSIFLSLSRNLPGHSLIYTLGIVFVITLIVSSMILYNQLFNKYFDRLQAFDNLVDDFYSVEKYIQGNPEVFSGTGIYDTEIPGSSSKTIIEVESRGIFNFVKINLSNIFGTISKAYFVGYKPGADSCALIYLGSKPQIKVAGETKISGLANLSKSDIGNAYINNNPLHQPKLTLDSVPETFVTNNSILTELNSQIKSYVQQLDTAFSLQVIEYDDKVFVRSFDSVVKVLHLDDPISIFTGGFKGNWAICSGKQITVGANAKLNDVVLHAPVIMFESGFEGNVFAYATDSIVVHNDCILEYPTALGLYHYNEPRRKYLYLGKEARIDGVIYMTNSIVNRQQTNYTLLDQNSLVRGQVVCGGYIEPNGTIYGTVAFEKTIAHVGGNTYNQTLWNSKIHGDSLIDNFSGINLNLTNYEIEFAKQLY